MAKTSALSETKQRLIEETERQRHSLASQCSRLQLAATLVEKGHQVAFTAVRARNKLNPFTSLFSKRAWFSVPGIFQKAQTILGLIQTVKATTCRPVAMDARIDFETHRRF